MRVSRSTDHFDLLPYIAILMCTLGTLLLVTLCMAAINLGPGAGESWISTPDPTQSIKLPVLFIWDGKTLIVQHDTQRKRYTIPLQALSDANEANKPIEDLEKQTEDGFKQVKDDMSENLDNDEANHYALFAVRPSGFSSFFEIRNFFKDEDITIGYEPISQSKSVRLAPSSTK